jgi:phage FluMu gp28-like protein
MYASFREAEDLLSGFLRDVTIWKEKEHVLDESDIKYLKAKRDRIGSYVSIFDKNKIRTLSDLPSDYRGVQGTEAITGTIPTVAPSKSRTGRK